MKPQLPENETTKEEVIKQMAKIRAKMPPSQRAKQFAPFDALTGLKIALKEKEQLRVPRKQLTDDAIEEINNVLKILKTHDIITIVHYNNIEQKYIKTIGVVQKIDPKNRALTVAEAIIYFEDIYTITKPH